MKALIKSLAGRFGYEIHRIPLPRTAHDQWATQRDILRKLEIDDPTILDIGANIGSTTAHYRRLFPLGRVYSFGPFPEVFQDLSRRFSTDNQVESGGPRHN